MKKRIIWKMFLLEIVTLGIYRLYWLIKTRNEMMKTNPHVKIKSPWFLLFPVIIIIISLVVAMISLLYASSKSSDCTYGPVTTNTQTDNGVVNTTESGTTLESNSCNDASNGANITSLFAMIILYLAFPLALVFYVIWLWGYCQGVEIITGEKISFAVALVILILVPDGIDILIIQDGFNKVVDRSAGHTPVHHPQPPAPAAA